MLCVVLESVVDLDLLFPSNVPLSSLTLRYAAEGPGPNTSSHGYIAFNLCGTIKDPELQVGTCTNTTSACEYSNANTTLIGRDYGDLNSQVLQAGSENGELTYVNVTYSSTTPCPAVPSKPFQTRFRIVCDYGTKFELVPVALGTYVLHTGTCSALIQAASLHACPLNRNLCKFTLHDSPARSAVYELGSLATNRLTVYEAYGPPNTAFNSSSILFNICAPVLIPFKTSGDCDSDTAACLVSTVNSGTLSTGVGDVRPVPLPLAAEAGAGAKESFERLGLDSSLEVLKHPGGLEAGVVLGYRDGSRCGSESYTFRLQLDCDPSCHPPGLCIKPQGGGGGFSLSSPPCGFLVIAGSSAACPVSIGGDSSPASIVSLVMLNLLVGGFVLYCCLGALVNLARGRRDSTVLPNHDSWVKLVSYVKAGAETVARRIGSMIGCWPSPTIARGNVGLSEDSDAGLGEAGSGGPADGNYGTF